MHDKKIKMYTDYFQDIESQILILKKYIHFDTKNYKVFSFELLKLLQIICSEVDTLAKYILNEELSKKQYNNITIKQWGLKLQEIYSDKIYIDLFFDQSIIVHPYSNNWKYEEYDDLRGGKRIKLCNNCKSLDWWLAYNNVKHQRVALVEEEKTNFEKASLENVINAFAGLYILELILIEKFKKQNQFTSKLLCLL